MSTREQACLRLDRAFTAINAVLAKYDGQTIVSRVGQAPLDSQRVVEEAVGSVTLMGFDPSSYTHFNPDVSTMNHVRDLFLYTYVKDERDLQIISEDPVVADHVVEKIALEAHGMAALAAYWHYIVSNYFDVVSAQVRYVCIGYDGKAYLTYSVAHRHPGGWAQTFRTKKQLSEMLVNQAAIINDHHRAGVYTHEGVGYLERTPIRTAKEYEKLRQQLLVLKAFLPNE